MSGKGPTLSSISAAEIRQDVLERHLKLFFGSSATFEKRQTKDGREAYLIRSNGVEATRAIIEDLRALSRKADENDWKASHKAQKIPKLSQQYGRSSEQAPYPPHRHDSFNAKSEIGQFDSELSPAFSSQNTSGLASPRGARTGGDISRAATRSELGEGELRKDFRLFPETEQEDKLQHATESRHPPRNDSFQPPPQDPRLNYLSGGADVRRGSDTVATQQAQRSGQDRYQQSPEYQYRSSSEKGVDIEARHNQDVSQTRQPALAPQSLHPSYLDQDRPQQSYVSSYPSSTIYSPGEAKKEGDFKDFREWQEYRRQKKEFEQEQLIKLQRAKYDEQRDTPPPRYEIEPQKRKPRQPSPDGTHGQNRERKY